MKPGSPDIPPLKSSMRSVHGRGRASSPRLRRILVPLDFSGRARQALRYAIPVAQRFHARIVLFHALVPAPLSASGLALLSTHFAEARRNAMRRLNEIVAEWLAPELHARNIVRPGNPAAEILAAVARERIDLIVMSTQGRTGLKRLLVGSTAEHVMRHASCPVLSVRRRS